MERARAMAEAHRARATPKISQDHWKDDKPPDAPSALVEAVSLGGITDGKSKPYVRHVIVKNLHQIAHRLQYKLPRDGVFKNRASMGLYALFDGQSCAGDPGPMAADFCARNFHTQLLQRLSALPDHADANSVLVALTAVFKDLDGEILENNMQIEDGCGAVVVLLIGELMFTALLGQCSAVLCQVGDGQSKAWSFGHMYKGVLECDIRSLKKSAAINPIGMDASGVFLRHPSGDMSRVSRSLGDRIWKQSSSIEVPLISCTPDVRTQFLKGAEHPFILLVASAVLIGMSPQQQVDVAQEFPLQPRAACGEIASRALKACVDALGEKAQCTVVEVCFLSADQQRFSAGPQQPPAAKKAKLADTNSMRLRHIMLKFSEGSTPAKGSNVTRTRQEAESQLREAIRDLRKEMQMISNPKDATELVSKITGKFASLCRGLSECDTAKKGGNMCGELGWMTPEQRGAYGVGFKDVVDVLLPGQLSDIAASNIGLHLVQRMA